MDKKSTFITKPFLPPLNELLPYLEKIWESRILTNGGRFHQELESRLSEYLGVEHLCLFTNATIALITALQALRIKGEVITTPFSFVATSHSLLWNEIKPVFVDIDPTTLNINPEKIEAAITPQTSAIMPVHCYGNPCDVDKIENIASRYNLKVIYDAAHAFGVQCHCGSILNHGDMSILSFHATKVFNTFEGGAIICPDEKTKQRINYLKNFGFADEVTVVAPGINGKMSEFNSALGILQLKYIQNSIESRKKIDLLYRGLLENISGIQCIKNDETLMPNYAYFPILIMPEFKLSRDELYYKFRENNVIVRRYFYPLISEFAMYRGLPSSAKENLPVASLASQQILCLPIFPEMDTQTVHKVVKIILNN